MTLPLLGQLNNYSPKTFWKDLMAGLTVAVMLIPQGMAYAILAGMPPIYGLYAGFIPLLVYPFFASSRHLSVGPVALVSIIMLSGLSELATPGSAAFIQLAILVALMAGLIQVILSIFRMGFLVNFLSHPVISGFTAAAAIIITISQLRYFLGLDMTNGSNILDTLSIVGNNINQVNGKAIGIGVVCLLIIFGAKKISKKIPGYLIALVASILAVVLFDWGTQINIIGDVPAGLPHFEIPKLTYDKILKLLPLALVISLISFIESMAIAKTIASNHGNYPINANKELLGLGMAKIIGSFFQAFPNTGSFGRSAINDQSGAQTGLASVFAFIFVGVTLLFFTTCFYYLPYATLAAIVIAAVFGLIHWQEARTLYTYDKRDFAVLMATFLLTLFTGILTGVLFGIGISLLLIIHRVSRPHYAVLGNLPDTNIYRNINRFDEAITNPNDLIFRYDDDIFFGNAEHFYFAVLEEVKNKQGVKTLILDASGISDIDSTGVQQLLLLKSTLDKMEITFLITALKGPVRDIFKRYDLHKHFPENQLFMSIPNAVDKFC